MKLRPRTFLAPNASPMTMAGTITYVVGQRIVAIIDPGSSDPGHLDALAAVAAEAERAVIIVTHDHPDHSTGALELAERTGAALLGGHARKGARPERVPAKSTHSSDRQPDSAAKAASRGATPTEVSRAAGGGLLADGASVATDQGRLVVVRTPGHAPDHISLHWPEASAVFCGDLMMGGLDTAVVAAPDGDIGEYLESLNRIRSLHPEVIYPAHGPPFTDPVEAIDRYVRHREERLEQVREATRDGEDDAEIITDRVYGAALEPSLRPFAVAAVQAYLGHIRRKNG